MKSIIKMALQRPEIAAFILMVMIGIAFQMTSNGIFLNQDNLRGLLGLLPEVALVAIGVTLLMISGEFDLSVGSVFAFTPMIVVTLVAGGWPFLPALLIGLIAAALVGLINGYITLRFDIPSFISTLGMMFIVRSLTVVVSGGFPPRFNKELIPVDWFVGYIDSGNLIRVSLIWFIAIIILLHLLLNKTNFGNWIRATGGFLPAAKALGIPTTRVKILCFIIAATLAGFAGLLQAMRLGSALPSMGEGLELQAVASAVIGGTALTGGIGTVIGGLLGAMLIRIIDNGMVLSQINSNWFKFAVGSLTILAVIGNSLLRRQAHNIKVETSPSANKQGLEHNNE